MPVRHGRILPLLAKHHRQIHNYLGLCQGGCLGEACSQIALCICLGVKQANLSDAASLLPPAWRNVAASVITPRVAFQPDIEPRQLGSGHRKVQTPSNPLNFQSVLGYFHHQWDSSASRSFWGMGKFWQLLKSTRARISGIQLPPPKSFPELLLNYRSKKVESEDAKIDHESCLWWC